MLHGGEKAQRRRRKKEHVEKVRGVSQKIRYEQVKVTGKTDIHGNLRRKLSDVNAKCFGMTPRRGRKPS